MSEQAPLSANTSTTAAVASDGQRAEAVSTDSAPARDTHVSRGTRAERSRTERPERHLKVRDNTAPPPEAAAEATEAKPWEAPAYAKAWKEQYRKAYERLATHPELGDTYKEFDGFFNEIHEWDRKRNAEIGYYRKRYDGVSDLIGQMDHQYTRQGMSLQQGLGQLWQTAQDLAADPDNTLARIGHFYKPKNAAQVINALAQAWGANLSELAQSAPYVDPVVQRELSETRAALQQIQSQTFQQQQNARQHQFQQLIHHISEFETAKDASGTLKHPYAAEVGQEMGILLQTGRATSLEQAYDMASKFHPKAQEERQKAAEKTAREDAARKTADAEQARAASRNVNGRPTGRDSRVMSKREAIEKALKQTYGAR